MTPTGSLIPSYIMAASLIGLRRQMLLNNAKKGQFIKYFDIQKVKEGGRDVWIAWYFENLNEHTDDLFKKDSE